jgi:hypothetical protein
MRPIYMTSIEQGDKQLKRFCIGHRLDADLAQVSCLPSISHQTPHPSCCPVALPMRQLPQSIWCGIQGTNDRPSCNQLCERRNHGCSRHLLQLRRHSVRHTGSKPFKCPHCERRCVGPCRGAGIAISLVPDILVCADTPKNQPWRHTSSPFIA